jgi:excisionase family DNA binding protein
MSMTDEDCRRLKGGEPFGVKPTEASRLIGESKNTVYRLLAAGKLRAVKRGTTTLVLMDSIREHVASLPAATFLPRN